MSTPKRQTLEQGRAASAFKKAVAGFNKHSKEYSQAVKKVPMMLKTNGLGATLAFMYSKRNVLGTILKHLEEWATENSTLSAMYNKVEGKNFVEKATNMDAYQYKTFTIEMQAYLMWLRRFAEGIVKEKETAESKEKSV